MPVSTADLIRRFQRGQSGAFDALFERYQDYVYRVAFFITRNSGDAEEAVQETFIYFTRLQIALFQITRNVGSTANPKQLCGLCESGSNNPQWRL